MQAKEKRQTHHARHKVWPDNVEALLLRFHDGKALTVPLSCCLLRAQRQNSLLSLVSALLGIALLSKMLQTMILLGCMQHTYSNSAGQMIPILLMVCESGS